MSLITLTAAQVLRLLPRTRISHAVGRLCDRTLPAQVSRVVTETYSRVYDVDLGEAEPRSEPYESFDSFFTRRLREGARPIDDASFVSPADGNLIAAGEVDSEARFLVKGRPYSVADLVGDEADAPRYERGSYSLTYLSPRDYHRVHSPVDGAISLVRSLPGDLYPVNTIGERHVKGLFARNLRVAICIDTESLGRVTLVMVGALIVGRISVSVIPRPAAPVGTHPIVPGRPVSRGDEVGQFHLGSSTVVFTEPGVRVTREPGPILLGQSLVSGA